MNNSYNNSAVTINEQAKSSALHNLAMTVGSSNIDDLIAYLQAIKAKGALPGDEEVYAFVLGGEKARREVKKEIHELAHGEPHITVENSSIATIVQSPPSVSTSTTPAMPTDTSSAPSNTTQDTAIDPNWEPEILERYQRLVKSLDGLNLFLKVPMYYDRAVMACKHSRITCDALKKFVAYIKEWKIMTEHNNPRLHCKIRVHHGWTLNIDADAFMNGFDGMLHEWVPNSKRERVILTSLCYLNTKGVLKKTLNILTQDVLFGRETFKYLSSMEPCENQLIEFEKWKRSVHSKPSNDNKRKRQESSPSRNTVPRTMTTTSPSSIDSTSDDNHDDNSSSDNDD